MLKTKNLHLGLLVVVLTIIVAMAAVPTVIAQVTWSAEAELYRDSILPCVMTNVVNLGMPVGVVPQAICVVETGAENIAAGTDMVVDVEDVRAAMMTYNYNQKYVAGDTLAAMCYTQNGLELGLFTSLPGKDPQVNCLEGTGISPVNCTTLIAWMCANADAINAAMESACTTCAVTWDPTRPISGTPDCQPVLSVVPYDSPEVNQTFTVNIDITNVFTNVILSDFEFKLWYDSTLINATDVVLGPALAAKYAETVKNLTVPVRVWYGCNLTTPPPLTISATETLATINFTALEIGTSLLHLNETVLHTLTDTTPVEQDHTTEDADITVVLPGTPVAKFTYTPTDPTVDDTVTFNASASYDPDGNLTDPDSYAWDFGDETTGTGKTVDHTYTTPGDYTVVLNVTDDDGKWDTESKSIKVSGPPVASFTYTPTDPTVDDAVTFDASASTPDGGTIISYEWDFGDETTGTGKTVNHTYTTPGDYTVVLNVTDSEGLWDTESKSITVAAAPEPEPEPEFPWLWVGVVVVIVVVVAAVAIFFAVRRRK